MPILTDYSQLAISCALVFPEDMKKGQDTKKMQDIIRHVTLKSLVTYKSKHSRTYGELVLACDASPYWRKDIFPYYKAHRAKDREDSDIDWDSVKAFVDDLRQDIEAVFPYPVVRYQGAEGDDCIAVVAKHLQTEPDKTDDNPLAAMTGSTANILIVSSDHDYLQLQKFRGIKQWAPMQKKFVTSDDPDFLVNKIITGDKGDGVPSVLMPDDWLVNGEGRATSVTKAVKDKFKNLASLTDEERKRYDRNRTLIDFDCIPNTIRDGILNSYNQERKKPKRQAIFDYLVKHRCRELIDRLEEF